MLEPSGGGDGIAYGVIGYAGTAKVAIYSDTVGNFATTKLLGSTTAQKANGVGFFITRCRSRPVTLGAEINTASSELCGRTQSRVQHQGLHERPARSDQLQPGDLAAADQQVPRQVPISQRRGRGWPAGGPGCSRTGPDFSSCSPRTDRPAPARLRAVSPVPAGSRPGQSTARAGACGQNTAKRLCCA